MHQNADSLNKGSLIRMKISLTEEKNKHVQLNAHNNKQTNKKKKKQQHRTCKDTLYPKNTKNVSMLTKICPPPPLKKKKKPHKQTRFRNDKLCKLFVECPGIWRHYKAARKVKLTDQSKQTISTLLLSAARQVINNSCVAFSHGYVGCGWGARDGEMGKAGRSDYLQIYPDCRWKENWCCCFLHVTLIDAAGRHQAPTLLMKTHWEQPTAQL